MSDRQAPHVELRSTGIDEVIDFVRKHLDDLTDKRVEIAVSTFGGYVVEVLSTKEPT